MIKTVFTGVLINVIKYRVFVALGSSAQSRHRLDFDHRITLMISAKCGFFIIAVVIFWYIRTSGIYAGLVLVHISHARLFVLFTVFLFCASITKRSTQRTPLFCAHTLFVHAQTHTRISMFRTVSLVIPVAINPFSVTTRDHTPSVTSKLHAVLSVYVAGRDPASVVSVRRPVSAVLCLTIRHILWRDAYAKKWLIYAAANCLLSVMNNYVDVKLIVP